MVFSWRQVLMYTSMYSVFRKVSGRIQKLPMPKQTNKKVGEEREKERYKSNKNPIRVTEGNR